MAPKQHVRTCSRGANDHCTDGATPRRGAYRDEDGEKEQKRRKQGKKARTIVLKASIVVAKLPVSATKPRRGSCHTTCHLIPTLVDRYQVVSVLQLSSPPSVNKLKRTKQHTRIRELQHSCSTYYSVVLIEGRLVLNFNFHIFSRDFFCFQIFFFLVSNDWNAKRSRYLLC